MKFSVSFPMLLLIIFIVLKLTGNITWSWIWVLSPFWITILIGLLLTLIVFFIETFRGKYNGKTKW